MANVIEQTVSPTSYGGQIIEMNVRSNQRGPQGEKGDTGEAASVTAGQAYTIEYGGQPQVINSGTPNDAVFDFYIPAGQPGAIHYYAGPGINITPDNRIEATGEMAVYWGDLVGSINNQTDLVNALNTKQNNLTAGSNIQIVGDTISATDTTYSNFVGTNGTSDGVAGLVPAPDAISKNYVLTANGSWNPVGSNQLAINAVGTTNIKNSAVTTDKIKNAAVTTDKIASNSITVAKLDKPSILDLFYPVGSYYETSNTSFDPNVSWGGTWTQDTAGRITVAYDDSQTEFDSVGETGGEKSHTLIEAELPSISGKVTMHSSNSATNVHAVEDHFTSDIYNPNSYRDGGTTGSGAASCGNMIFSFGSGQAHNNLQPYVVVKRWHRIA